MGFSCETSIKTDGASSEIIPGSTEKCLHSFKVGTCSRGHTVAIRPLGQ